MALDQKQLEAIPESTKKSTTWSTKIFNRFLFNKNMSVDLKNDPPMVVAGALRKFYANVTKADGTLYPGGSLNVLFNQDKVWKKINHIIIYFSLI